MGSEDLHLAVVLGAPVDQMSEAVRVIMRSASAPTKQIGPNRPITLQG